MIQEDKEKSDALLRQQEAIQQERQRIHNLFMQAPAYICVLQGPEHRLELINPLFRQLYGNREFYIGEPPEKNWPELQDTGLFEALDAVYQTGESFIVHEYYARIDRNNDGELEDGYFTFIYQQTRDAQGNPDGILMHGFEVTDQVLARKKVEESEERFRTMADASPQAMWMTDTEGRTLFFNKWWSDYCGVPYEPTTAADIAVRFLHPDDAPVVMAAFDEARRTGRGFEVEQRNRSAAGEYRWFLNRAEPYRDRKTDEIIGWFGVGVDIHDRKEAEIALKEREEALRTVTAQQEETLALLESLLDNAPVGFAFFDKEHRYIRINDTLAEINGIAAQDHIGKTIQELLPVNGSIVTPVLDSVMATKEPVLDLEVTGETPREPGVTRHWLTGFYPVFIGKSRDVDYVGAVVIEITTMKRLEQQKDEFLAVASHELKTPVTSIKAYAQVLQRLFKSKGDMQSAGLLAKMDAQINKLITLIADLLDVSKMHAGKLQLRLNNFDFNALVLEVVDEIQRTTTQHTIHTALTESKMIYGDRDRIGQVITNFLTNAVKYSPHADSVIVKTHADEETITLSVQDFGPGIPQEKQARVFEQFYRVEGHKENIYPGLGLGLYISSEIIHRHEGTIGVESEEGKGSTFSFTLPTQQRTLQQPADTLDEEAIRHE